MGSDQSSHGSRSRGKNPKRSQSAGSDTDVRGGSKTSISSSPRPSICSESDIPYISYTATRPIADDQFDRQLKWSETKPKSREKQISREKRDSKSKSAGSIVIVKAAAEAPTLEKDPLYRRLLDIPPFAPIIRNSLKVPWTKDPEITEKIDTHSLIRISLLYEERLLKHAESVGNEQARLASCVGEIDAKIGSIMKSYGDSQRRCAKYAERFNKILDLSHGLTKCHRTLNHALESIEILNNLLPPDDRLEPFVWTTG